MTLGGLLAPAVAQAAQHISAKRYTYLLRIQTAIYNLLNANFLGGFFFSVSLDFVYGLCKTKSDGRVLNISLYGVVNICTWPLAPALPMHLERSRANQVSVHIIPRPTKYLLSLK